MSNTWRNRLLTLFLLLLAVVAVVVAVSFGSTAIPFADVVRGITFPDDSIESRILWEIRLPRALLGFVVGGLLALAGALMQTLLRNPLADPYILGTSGGAAVAVLLAFLFSIPGVLHPLIAFGGATFSTLLLLLIARSEGGLHNERLILTGIILTTGWGAISTFLLTAAPFGKIPGMLFWLVGDIGESSSLLLPAATLVVGLLFAMLLAKPLDILLLGDQQAASLGVAVSHLRYLLLLLAALLTAIAVATAGPIGFIGLVTPHLVRLLGGAAHRWLLPGSLLLGGSLVTLADMLSRTMIAPRQLPVGIFTALIGVPVFLLLLHRHIKGKS